jgi:DDE domain
VKISIDGSGANGGAIKGYNEAHDAELEIRQVKCLNNVVEQDHRAIKRQVRPMMGFKSFWSAAATLACAHGRRVRRENMIRQLPVTLPPSLRATRKGDGSKRQMANLAWRRWGPYLSDRQWVWCVRITARTAPRGTSTRYGRA